MVISLFLSLKWTWHVDPSFLKRHKKYRHSVQNFPQLSSQLGVIWGAVLLDLAQSRSNLRKAMRQCTALWMDSQVFYEWRRSRDPSTSPNWYFPHNCVNILRTGVVVLCVCAYVLEFNLKLRIFLTSRTPKSTWGQSSFEFFSWETLFKMSKVMDV